MYRFASWQTSSSINVAMNIRNGFKKISDSIGNLMFLVHYSFVFFFFRASRIGTSFMCWDQNKVTEQRQHITSELRHSGKHSNRTRTGNKVPGCLSWHHSFCPILIFFLWTHFNFPVSVLQTSHCYEFIISWLGFIN